jgi:hypothetical protein
LSRGGRGGLARAGQRAQKRVSNFDRNNDEKGWKTKEIYVSSLKTNADSDRANES